MASESTYLVVVNDEEQYSLWPSGRSLPAGWHSSGHSGTEEDCLAHIAGVWTEVLPRSARPA
ncbi:MbtH family NRPS accessory protein [Prauserella halophila]|uniref:MbtH family NRPS accessory protein n=1 Tax=Prauserella halophila TaxID=185641 RepID=A0ABN1W355_9PSEU|nr:MbtH family protein [Prauserella halophila]MCP2235302.1 MbtH protein [Prauserella halophila]